MADIVIADSTAHYDGRYLETHPLGATETSVIYLARALARRGHRVTVFTHCDAAIEHEGVSWRSLAGAAPASCDLNLRRLVEIWADSILPRVPEAVLDVYGIHDLGSRDAWQTWEGTLLPSGLPAHVKASVRVHQTAPRQALMEAMRASRVMLYLGHECEAFCVALAEAQAFGVPAVVAPVAALPERVIDGVTGFHRADPKGFADAAVALMIDDALWRRQHEACLRERCGIGWSDFASRFEAAVLGNSL